MGHDEPALGAIARHRQVDAVSPEDEEVEVDLPRPPPCPAPAAEVVLDRLASVEQGEGRRGRIGAESDVDGGDGVEEVRLGRTDGCGPVEIGHGPERQAGRRIEAGEGRDEAALPITEVRPEPDVGADPGRGPPPATVAYSTGMSFGPTDKRSSGAAAGGSDVAAGSLANRLRRRIEADGPLPFARFMEIALTDPVDGYYTAARARPTRSGDYLTAPELHPIFGHCLAHQIIEVWERLDRPVSFMLREYGAGAGTLALAVLDEIRRAAPPLLEGLRYEPVEVNPHRLTELRAGLEAAGFAARLHEPDDGPRVGVVLANEYLDALPVHRFVVRDGRLRERYVDWSGERFVEVEGPPSDPEAATAAARLAAAAPGTVVEVRPAVARWLETVAAVLRRGVAIVVDYGGSAAELFGPHHPEGTLVAYRHHRVAPDPLAEPGEQDLTAHVDFTDLETRAAGLGLRVLGSTSQAAFLVGCGLEDLLRREQASPTATLEDLLLLRSAVRRLLDPRALGNFRVVVLGRDIEPPLIGLSARLPGAAR